MKFVPSGKLLAVLALSGTLSPSVNAQGQNAPADTMDVKDHPAQPEIGMARFFLKSLRKKIAKKKYEKDDRLRRDMASDFKRHVKKYNIYYKKLSGSANAKTFAGLTTTKRLSKPLLRNAVFRKMLATSKYRSTRLRNAKSKAPR